MRYALLMFVFFLAGCPDATEVATQCVAVDLVGQCPAGSNPVLGAAAESSCGGAFDLNVVTESGAATGQCQSNGTCEFLCQYASPCSCGVATLSKEAIVCAECQDQSCGDGRCEGTERATCEAGATACLPCAEDCSGSTCGDGDCTGIESPETCPQDCGDLCTPNSKVCVGPEVHACSADGRSKDVINCANAGLICGGGTCVAPGACGNQACESNESAQSCPQDCGTFCVPSSVTCQGNLLVTCNANGSSFIEVDCAEDGFVCGGGECKRPDVCGNDICEAGEDVSCAADCASECGNQECENGETNSCPQDCTTCGDRLCGANEIATCPQDCGVCVPSERFCLGKLLRVCNANGTNFEDIDCTAFDQSCVTGNCVDPGVCGNGACESGEDDITCAVDCTDVCGDDICQDSESFVTCSIDCDPTCGDASCQGGEDHGNCPFDCLATCGNGLCDGGEDRDNCPKDCGYCGNGVCEDAAESSSLFPANPLVTCLEDCVVSGCQQDGECDDGIFCTTGECSADGVCQYTASDALCPVNEKCIKFSGCCPDADRDGFADAACGGSDCDDDDALTYPGAVEVCGGGDRNCNGFHRPALKPAKKVTSTSSYKSGLAMTWDGTRFWAAWRGVPVDKGRVELARISRDGDLVGSVGTVPNQDVRPGKMQVAWSAQTNRLGVAWHVTGIDGARGTGAFGVFDANGALEGAPITTFVSPHMPNNYAYTEVTFTRMTWHDGVWVLADAAWYNNGAGGFQGPYGWWAVTEVGDASRRWAGNCYEGHICNGGASALFPFAGEVVGLQGTDVYKVTPADTTGAITKVSLTPEAAQGKCVLDDDGEMMALVCKRGSVVTYHRIAPNGAAVETAQIYDTMIEPVAIATAIGGLGAGDSNKVGVLGSEGQSLVFLMRDEDTSAVVEPGAIGGGGAFWDPQLFWDGDAFQAFWLAKSGDIEQLYRTTITCE